MPRDWRVPNLACKLEKEILENWGGGRRGWWRFCRVHAPGEAFYTCCLREGHTGEVHIVFTVEPKIMYRWTTNGTQQP